MESESSENRQGKTNGSKTNDVLTPGQHTLGEVNMEATITADDIMLAGGFGATDSLSSILPVASDFTDFEGHLLEARDYENNPEGKEEIGSSEEKNAFGEVNMEASITPDEVTRAGGYGAKDDISSFLPVASDFTDFEANLRGAREYEDFLNEEIHRPGLGWSSETK
ncbi:elongation factor 1-beta [Striga asiatica]|uniref:Elongation factor 1-beta n=1 Tax=Striga asiatica TaxID=4170 RepID=A0A5A7R5I0_STRAF|nr:elongation factor 1-beta [Striga asiatica]